MYCLDVFPVRDVVVWWLNIKWHFGFNNGFCFLLEIYSVSGLHFWTIKVNNECKIDCWNFSYIEKKISICSRCSYSLIINKINWTNKLFIFMCNEYFINKKKNKKKETK
jgi:hypothetical protein